MKLRGLIDISENLELFCKDPLIYERRRMFFGNLLWFIWVIKETRPKVLCRFLKISENTFILLFEMLGVNEFIGFATDAT